MESKVQARRSLEAIEQAIERTGKQRQADLHELLAVIDQAHQTRLDGKKHAIADPGRQAEVTEVGCDTLREPPPPVDSPPSPTADRPAAPESAQQPADTAAPSSDRWRRLRKTLHGQGTERA